jgi:hypothetical protein
MKRSLRVITRVGGKRRDSLRTRARIHHPHKGRAQATPSAHTVSDKVEAAYRRGDMREKRRRLMADWAAYCESPPTAARGKLVPMRT